MYSCQKCGKAGIEHRRFVFALDSPLMEKEEEGSVHPISSPGRHRTGEEVRLDEFLRDIQSMLISVSSA